MVSTSRSTRVHGVLLDLDGTLIDTATLCYNAYQLTLASYGFLCPPLPDLLPRLGASARATYATLIPASFVSRALRKHKAYQLQHSADVRPFPGVRDTLYVMRGRGIKLAVITNRPQLSAEAILESSDLSHTLDCLIAAEDVNGLKPNPKGVLVTLARWNVDPSEALLVGDTCQDIDTARNAQVRSVGVTYGFLGPAIQKCNPDMILSRFSDLLSVL
jgi:pyrophosphatase PpaX